ncbi:MAG: hypothetical protein RIB52_06655 [Erythrobacter sp.]|uniref:hypothetical protein n=1 Tax=Erythrobacter sp. TaxID=1042 RepID=UPI0032F06B81
MKWLFLIFLGLYALALALLLVGTFGLFGQERDPLAGIFLVPLGLPWNLIGDRIGLAGAWLGILAPAINAAILLWIWRR